MRPPVVVPRWSLAATTCAPVGVAYLAAALREAGHRVVVVDAVGEALDQFVPYADRFLAHGLTPAEVAARIPSDADVVGISCLFSHEWPLTREVIAAIGRRCSEALLVAGGEHITALPEESLRDCTELDVAVLGEGEETLVDVVAARTSPGALRGLPGTVVRHRGELVSGPARQRIRDVDGLPRPAWDLVPLERYLEAGHGFGVHRGRSVPLVATRGCPYRCTFCSSPQMWTTRYQVRRPDLVLEEIRDAVTRHGAANIDLYDLTAVVRRSWTLELCRLIIESGLRVTWQLPSGTRSEAIDGEVARALHAAGCRNLSYAPESGSPRVLDLVRKRVDLDRMRRSMREAVAAGINCKANIILGFPGETHRDVLQTLRFIVDLARLGLHDVSISPFSPYPGSALFAELRASGRIPDLDDRYYLSLTSYSDLTRAVSWSEEVSDRALAVYRMTGMALFYAVSFGRRPGRLARLVRNVARGGAQESRLEATLGDLASHFLPGRRRLRPAAPASRPATTPSHLDGRRAVAGTAS